MTVRKEKRKDPKTGRVREFWYVDVDIELPDGRRKRVRKVSPIQTRRDAEEYERQTRRAVLDGSIEKKEEKPVPTWEDFESRFIEGYARANRQKHSTVTSKISILKNHLLPRFGKTRLDDVDEEDVQAIKYEMRAKSAKTTNNVLSVFNTVLKVAKKWKVIDEVPVHAEMLKFSKKEIGFYEPEVFEFLVEGAMKADPRIGALVLLGGEAGLRIGEIMALEMTDVDFRRGHINVQRAVWRGVVDRPKGGRSRRVPLTKRVAAALQKIRHLRGALVLYRDGDDGAVTQKTAEVWMKTAQRRAGLPVTGRLHVLRHTFCSRLAMLGASPRAIMELAGHADISTTMGYMHLSPKTVDLAMKLLETDPSGNLTATQQEAEEG